MVVKLSAMHFPSLAVASLIALSFMGIEETVAKNQIVPPYEWTSTPAWSADGRFVAVTWPAPPIVAADGTLTRVIGKSEKDSNMSVWPTQPTISATAKAPVGIRTNFDERKTLFLNASTYERLPISIPDELRDASWSPDGKMIAGYDCRLSKGSIFEAANGKVILIIPDDKPGFMSGFIWSPDSKRIAVAQGDGVHVWDVPGKKQAYSLPNLAGPCRSISWSPNGKAIAALGATYRESPTTAIRLCAADTGRSLFSVNSQSGVGSAAWSSNGTYFAYSDKSVHILRSDSMDEIVKLEREGKAEPATLEWSPDGKLLAYKGTDPKLHIFDVSRKQELSVIPAEKTGRFSFEWSPNSAYLAISDYCNQVAVCDASTGQYLGAKLFDGGSVTHWTPDGQKLVVCDFTTESVSLVPVNLSAGNVAFEGGSSGNPWKNQRVLRNLDDCFDELTHTFSPTDLERFKNTKESDLCLYTGGPGLGMELRNTWGLRGHTPLVEYFNKLGITDGASMSTIIIESFWRHLNANSPNIDKQIEISKQEEESEAPIVSENQKLSDKLLQFEAVAPDGKKLSIAKQAGKVRVVSFVCTKYGPSAWLLSCLQDLRKKYSMDQVSIIVFTFTPGVLDIPEGKTISGVNDCSKEIAAALSGSKSTIRSAPGSRTMLNDLSRFVQGRMNRLTHGLPQTLIVTESGLVTTRFNGWWFDQHTMQPIEEAVNKTLEHKTTIRCPPQLERN